MKLDFRKSLAAAAVMAGLALAAAPAMAARTAEEPTGPAKGVRPVSGEFTFEGPRGRFARGQLQRAYKVYKEVCSACHSMSLVHFRDLGAPGGPFYDPKYKNPNDNPEVKALAADVQVSDIDTTTGDVIKRKGTPADTFPSPFPNAIAAAASNGGATPPDQSTLAKAREGGARYIYSLLMGYREPPKGLTVGTGQHYNPWFPGDVGSYWSGDKNHVPKGGFIAMAPPLADNRVTYDDGTKATTAQEAADVAAFLEWASDPHAEQRKKTGMAVMAYLAILGLLTYLSYRAIWKNVGH